MTASFSALSTHQVRLFSIIGLVFLALMISVVPPGGTAHGQQGEIGALGKIEPKSGVLTLTGNGNTNIQSVEVNVHDEVKKGQILVTLSNHDVLKAERDLAKLELEEFEKTSEDKIELKELAVTEAQQQLARARRELMRYQSLPASSRAARELAKRRSDVEDAGRALRRARIELSQLKAELEVGKEKAKRNHELAQGNYQSSIIVAPTDGTVLDIQKNVGEAARGPVILMANLEEMYVVCDVFEGDVLRIKPGMKAKVSSNSLPQAITGTVQNIGRVIDTRNRLAKVRIRLDEASIARQLVGLEVSVAIGP